MMFQDLVNKIKTDGKRIIAVAAPVGESLYKALNQVGNDGLCSYLLVGDEELIREEANKYNLKDYLILNSLKPADDSVNAVLNKQAHVLMKGKLDTSIFLKAILNRKDELLTENLLSHLLVVESNMGRLLGVTDGGMNITPNLEQKASIIRNSINIFHNLGIKEPKVAVLTAMERINPAIPGAVDADLLRQMAEKGEIKGGIVAGPLAVDLALSRRACEIKGITGPIMGDADILVVPDMNSGNIFGKSLILCAGFPSGGLIAGASFPIVMLSRADEAKEKVNSIILALAAAGEGSI
ncbi:MAG: phosphate acyltransferase [Spirochaetaceae bacterium]